MEDSSAVNRRYTLLQRPKKDPDVAAAEACVLSTAAQAAASLEEREKLYEATKRRLMTEQQLPAKAHFEAASRPYIAEVQHPPPPPPPMLAAAPAWIAYPPYIPVWAYDQQLSAAPGGVRAAWFDAPPAGGRPPPAASRREENL